MKKGPIIWSMLIGVFPCIYAQQIFRTKLQGMAVQNFSSTDPIDGFTVSGPDTDGYVYLVAHAGTQSGEILRTKWQGTAVQEFTIPQGEYITGFDAEADATHVYLIAVASDGSKGKIVRTKWQGTCVQAYSVPSGQIIRAITTSGADATGYVYLSLSPSGVEEPSQDWLEPPRFNLEVISATGVDNVRIAYSLAKTCQTSIRIYDATGRCIANLVEEKAQVGSHEVTWDRTDNKGKAASAGVYFVKMDAGEYQATRKIIVVR